MTLKAITNKPIPIGFLQIPIGTEVEVIASNSIGFLFLFMGEKLSCNSEDLDILE